MALFGSDLSSTKPLLPYEVLDALAALDSRPFVGRTVNTAFFVATARLAGHFMTGGAAADASVLNCFVHNLSSSALSLLSCKLTPSQQNFIADCTSLMHRIHATTAATASLGATKMLLEACRQQHKLGAQLTPVLQYYGELLVTGDKMTYQAFSRNFATLCDVVAESDASVQPLLLTTIQSVLYMDNAAAFDSHHQVLIKLLSRTAKHSRHSTLQSSLKQAVTSKLLSRYAAGEINSIVRHAADAAAVDTASDCASTSYYAASDSASSCDSDDEFDNESFYNVAL